MTRHLKIVVPPRRKARPASTSSETSSRASYKRSISTPDRSTMRSVLSSPPSVPWNGWLQCSPRVLRIAALHHAAEQIDPNALDLALEVAANLLSRVQARGARAGPLKMQPIAPTDPPAPPHAPTLPFTDSELVSAGGPRRRKR